MSLACEHLARKSSTWGARMSDALRQIETFEFLFECELKTRSLLNHKA
ncbi:ribulose-5-phosphate 4-epimerase/fuculose-1-phosphate aldolase [Pseudomonas sp. ADAK2 TE3594]